MTDLKSALVVDDDETLRLVAKRFLAKMGFTVKLVGNGKEAVEACEQDRFDLILMDIQMPEMDGFEATTAIRSLEKNVGPNKSVIVAVTASQEHKRAVEAHMDDFLFKPLMHDNLKQMVQKWFPDQS